MSDTNNPQVVTRFAPSPTGYLHIGGARTALFNWLYARANGGKFLLRIEDTDRKRSTPQATAAIHDAMNWLGLAADEEPVSQFNQRNRHAEIAHSMLANGTAYKCFSTSEEIEAAKEKARESGESVLFQSPWRDVAEENQPDKPFVIRLKAPLEGEVKIKDKVQGKVTFKADTLDDLVLLRSDGTPTYMLAVVVDDHDMGVTHIIRGDDHLINAGRQLLIYLANGWKPPTFAHIPLIHGEDGKKLSKRHGATGAEEFRALGYMAEAMRNYLCRLGWSHGNDELFTTEQAIEWFDFKGMGKSPSRLDFKKLDNVSAHHIKTAPKEDLLKSLKEYVQSVEEYDLDENDWQILSTNIDILRDRSKKLPDVIAKAHFALAKRPLDIPLEAKEKINSVSNSILNELTLMLSDVSWTQANLEDSLKSFADARDLKFGQIAQPMRAALSGSTASPSIFEMMPILGKDETIARIRDIL